jgi:hypothetical protein
VEALALLVLANSLVPLDRLLHQLASVLPTFMPTLITTAMPVPELQREPLLALAQLTRIWVLPTFA